MRLNHLNLAVSDVPAARKFLETYFGLRCLLEREKGTFALLMDDTGIALAVSNFNGAAEVHYPGAFHVGFMQDSRERVDEMYERLTADGFQASPPRDFHGAWTFYLQAPGGFLVEVGHQYRLTQAG